MQPKAIESFKKTFPEYAPYVDALGTLDTRNLAFHEYVTYHDFCEKKIDKYSATIDSDGDDFFFLEKFAYDIVKDVWTKVEHEDEEHMVDQLREMTNCDGRCEECRHVENYPLNPKQLEELSEMMKLSG